MFSLRSTILIFVILFGCLVLRGIGFEPFPAVMLPSGAYNLQQTDKKIKVVHSEIYAADSAGNWQKINPEEFLRPVPIPLPELLPYITNTNADVDNKKLSRAKKLKYKTLKFLHLLKDTHLSQAKLDEMHTWIKSKFSSQHLSATQMKVVTIENTISTETGNVISSHITDEHLIPLVK
jgi:hypothetical protein